MANARVHVLDRCLGLAPAGVTGELFVAGAGVARGYLARPALTAERFIADPFAGDGSRMYRTGDLGRWRAGGLLEFTGRADEQVKVRGFRVELGEVEAALAACPGVRAAAVTAYGQDGDRRLAAWLVPADPATGLSAATELRALLAARLPDHMIPSAFTELAAFPLTPNGKVDRAALPDPDGTRMPAGRVRAPRHRDRGAAGRDLGRGAAGGPGRDRRQLLRPGRPLAAGHPGDLAGAGGVRG